MVRPSPSACFSMIPFFRHGFTIHQPHHLAASLRQKLQRFDHIFALNHEGLVILAQRHLRTSPRTRRHNSVLTARLLSQQWKPSHVPAPVLCPDGCMNGFLLLDRMETSKMKIKGGGGIFLGTIHQKYVKIKDGFTFYRVICQPSKRIKPQF